MVLPIAFLVLSCALRHTLGWPRRPSEGDVPRAKLICESQGQRARVNR